MLVEMLVFSKVGKLDFEMVCWLVGWWVGERAD
jgi:hypothetical protein